MAKSHVYTLICRSLAGLAAVAVTAAALADDMEGVAHVSRAAVDADQAVVVRGQSPDGIDQAGYRRRMRRQEDCPPAAGPAVQCPPAGGYVSDCPPGCRSGIWEHRSVLSNNCVADRLRICSMNHRVRNQIASDRLAFELHRECCDKFMLFRCKFGYFFPTGCCGKGCPPTGCYSMVYPLNPEYSDPRDSQVYGAPGYAGPVAVPLAPVVNQQYNYGWGVPSSRLTPISSPVFTY